MEELVDFIKQEVEAAIASAVDLFIASIGPGIFLRPFWQILPVIGAALFEASQQLANSLSRVPVKVLAKFIVIRAKPADSTKVCKLSDAKAFAETAILSSLYELLGRGPPALTEKFKQVSKLKGLRKRLIKAEERGILGPVLHRLLGIVRAPTRFIVLIVEFLWNLILILISLGAVVVVWDVVQSDWDEIALSQKHPRKRMKVSLNRRL